MAVVGVMNLWITGTLQKGVNCSYRHAAEAETVALELPICQ
jgi:hypothetical protein